MKYLLLLMLLLELFVINHRAHAEGGCPPGSYPINGQGWQTCAPIPNYDTQQQSLTTRPPSQWWEDRWGAVATDAEKGALGSASSMSSQASAERTALNECRSKGGARCKLDISYVNTCAAMVVGDRGYTVRTGGTREVAIDYGEKVSCSTKDLNCRVYYTDCSLPVRTR
jgi:hypothetical protein